MNFRPYYVMINIIGDKNESKINFNSGSASR